MEENTNYQVTTSVSNGILEIVITGELTKYTIDRIHDEVIKIIRENDAKAILRDIRAVKGPNEIGAAYFRVRSIPPDVKKLPAAVVDLSADIVYKSFYETTAANAGQSMKWFNDIEPARAWLKSKL